MPLDERQILNDREAQLIAWEYAKSVKDSGGSLSPIALGEELADHYSADGIDWTAIAVDLLPLDIEELDDDS